MNNHANSQANNFIFFGSSRLSVIVLDELSKHGIKPAAIVTIPDRPKGRKLVLTPPEVKTFGEERGIPVFQFEKLNADAVDAIRALMTKTASADAGGNNSDTIRYFLVASYGLIIPQAVLDLPFAAGSVGENSVGALGTLNVHPSLLPEYRGATPMQQALLDDHADTGVSIMLLDALMDHGPIFLQEKRGADEGSDDDGANGNADTDATRWPKRYADLEDEMARQGARMIASNIDAMLDGTLKPKEQDHTKATFTKKIDKADGLIGANEGVNLAELHAQLKGNIGRKNFLKFNAYYEWPNTYFFAKTKSAVSDAASESDNKPIRIKITDAAWDESANDGAGEMTVLKIIPEGQKETLWSEYKKKLA